MPTALRVQPPANHLASCLGGTTARQGPPVCNLYSLNKKRDAVARFFRVSHNRTVAFEPLSAIFPGHVARVVRQNADATVRLSLRAGASCSTRKCARRDASPNVAA